MTHKTPLPNSARLQAYAQPSPTSHAGNVLPLAISLVAAVAAGVFALLVKEPTYIVAGAVLVGVVGVIGGMLVFGQTEEDAPVATKDESAENLVRTLENNRAEYNAKIAELKKALEAQKAALAQNNNEALVDELGKIRAELGGLRGATTRR